NTPEAQAKLVKLAQEKMGQEKVLMDRLQAAQRAYLNANQGTVLTPPSTPLVSPQPVKSAPVSATPPGWITFNVPAGGFSVSLPGPPLAQDQQAPGLPKFKIYVAADVATKNAYSAIAIPMDQKAKAEYAQSPDQFYLQMTIGMSGATGQNVQPK